MSVAIAFNFSATQWVFSVNLIRMVQDHCILHNGRHFQSSTTNTFLGDHVRFDVHGQQCLFPSQVEHLKVVIGQLSVQQVVHSVVRR